jgi:hypothetical protein
MKRFNWFAAIIIVFAIGTSNSAFAVAYCALRDPVAAIHQLFPDSTSFKSNIGTVGPDIREALKDELPFDFHFNEFGRHTLYTVYDRGQPIGLAHARSELGNWGLDEFVWRLDLDLRVRGLYIQRTRDPSARLIDTENFRSQLDGLGLDELVAMLQADGNLRPGALSIDESAIGMARSAIHSAIKTIIVTRQAWARDLKEIRALALAREDLPHAKTVIKIDGLYSPAILDTLTKKYQISEPALDREDAVAYEILDANGEEIGIFVSAGVPLPNQQNEFRWVIGADGIAQSIKADTEWDDDSLNEIFGDIHRSKEDLIGCATPGEMAMLEILIVAGEQLDR